MSRSSPAGESDDGIVAEEASADLLEEGSGAASWRNNSEGMRLEAGSASLEREANLLEIELESTRVGDDPDERSRLSALAYALAGLRLAAGDAHGAELTLERSRALDPSFEPAWGPAWQRARSEERWPDVAVILERIVSRPGLSARDRADVWLEVGRVHEHKLGDANGAAEAYRKAARELPGDAGAGLALLLLGLRRAERSSTAEGLELLGAASAEPEARLGLLLAWAETERRRRGEDDTAVERARAALAKAYAVVDDEADRQSLHVALVALLGTAPTTAERRSVLETLLEVVPDAPASTKVALLRAHAALLRNEAGEPRLALAALQRALTLEPGRSSLWAEVCGLASQLHRPDLIVLAWTQVASAGELVAVADASRDFALSVGVALARGGRWGEASAFLLEHAELTSDEPDVFALVATVTARACRPDDWATLARLWEDQATRLGQGSDKAGKQEEKQEGKQEEKQEEKREEKDAGKEAEKGQGTSAEETSPHAQSQGNRVAADLLVMAATVLRRRLGAADRAEPLLRRAHELSPGHRPAFEALLDLQRSERRWLQLADTWEEELERLAAAGAEEPDRNGRLQRGLEELHAICRDELGDLRWADRVGERLVGTLGGARALVRRIGVVVAAGVAGQGQGPPADLWVALAGHAKDPGVAARLRLFAAEAFVREGDKERARELAEDAYRSGLPGPAAVCAVALLERLAPSDERRLGALEAELEALARADADPTQVRSARFRLALAALGSGATERGIAALQPLRQVGDPLALAWTWDVVRRLGRPAVSAALLEEAAKTAGLSPMPLRAEGPADRGEAWERAGQPEAARRAYQEALAAGFDVDAGLGAYRLASRAGDLPATVAALRSLAAAAQGESRASLSREAELLAACSGLPADPMRTADLLDSAEPRWDEERALLGWLQGANRRDHRGVAEGLLGVAVLAAAAGEPLDPVTTDSVSGLLLRAVARARVAGPSHARAVLERAWDFEPAEAMLVPAFSDQPLPQAVASDAGVKAREQRAHAAPWDLAVSLLMEAADACEAGGDAAGALALYGRVLTRAPETLDALWAIRDIARRKGDDQAWARTTVRIATVVRNPRRSGALWLQAAAAWLGVGRPDESLACSWRAVERLGATEEIESRIRPLFERMGDVKGFEIWLGHRLVAVTAPAARVALIWERALLRRDRLGKPAEAAQDFKRILKIDPGHRPSLEALALLNEAAGSWDEAAQYWERLLAVASRQGHPSLPTALSLADALARTGRLERAAEVLGEAIRGAPEEESPRERLVQLHVQAGDWAAAIAGLRGLAELTASSVRKATLEVRVGAILRDHSRDPESALASFVRAGSLDPVGPGWDEALILAESRGDRALRDQLLGQALIEVRRAVENHPLDPPLLRRLASLLDRGGRSAVPEARVQLAEAAVVVRQLLAVLGEEARAPALSLGVGRGLANPAFWPRLTAPEARGFALEIWPLLVDAVAELHPRTTPRLPDVKRRRVSSETEPAVAWIEALAVALGMPTLPLVMVATSGTSVFAVELPEPTLCMSMETIPRLDSPHDRFLVGRVLGLLRERAAVLEALPAPQLAGLLGAAAFVAGARPSLAPGALKNLETEARRLGKAMSRRSRRAVELEASRFGFEVLDAEAFQQGLLSTADRLGLLLSGDLSATLETRLGREAPMGAESLAQEPAILSLIRFALSEEHMILRHEAGLAGEAP